MPHQSSKRGKGWRRPAKLRDNIGKVLLADLPNQDVQNGQPLLVGQAQTGHEALKAG